MDKQPVIAQGTLLSVTWQLGWEGCLGENRYMYMYSWVPLLSSWNYLNIVNRLYRKIRKSFLLLLFFFFKKKKEHLEIQIKQGWWDNDNKTLSIKIVSHTFPGRKKGVTKVEIKFQSLQWQMRVTWMKTPMNLACTAVSLTGSMRGGASQRPHTWKAAESGH